LLWHWKKQLVAVGVVDLDDVVTPPRFLAGNRALDDLPAKLRKPSRSQLDEQARLVSARGILAEDDLDLEAQPHPGRYHHVIVGAHAV
jgi:hypothetical protein